MVAKRRHIAVFRTAFSLSNNSTMTLTIRERIEIVLLAGDRRNHGAIAEEFSKRHPDRPISRVTIASVLAKFKQTGSVYHNSHSIRRSKDYHKCSDLLENFSGSLPDSEPNAGNDSTDSRSPVHRMKQAPKGHRYILLEVDENRVDKLYDVLIGNGFHDFVSLNNFPDGSGFMDSVDQSHPAEELLTDTNGSDLLQTPTSSGSQSSSLFTVTKQDPEEEEPSFKVLSATDLLGTNDVEAGKDWSSSVLGLGKNFGKNYSSGTFHSISEGSLDGPRSELDFRAVHGEQGEKSYVNCRLCKSMILTSRFSNLANHARRHAVVKKYRCVHCCVQNNEYSRIRMHMATIHRDSNSYPVDNGSPETQRIWDFLLEKCFPYHLTINSEGKVSKSVVDENDGETNSSLDCGIFVCPICGFRTSDQREVHFHLSECHTEVDPTTCLITEYRTASFHGDLSLLTEEQSISTDIKSESWVTENHMQSSSNAAYNYDGESTSEQVSEITADNEENRDLDSVLCHLCNQSIVLAKLKDVVDHAKEHYHVKQFECELCGFRNNERLRVRSHAFHQHLYERPRIIEHNDESMKKAWTQVARKCFPCLPERLMKEKLKYLRSLPTSRVVSQTTPSEASKSGYRF